MAQLIYSAAMSTDGYIAGPGGDMSWLAGFAGPNRMADELMNSTGALLVGARTYYGDDPNRGDPEHEGAFGGAWHGPQIVVTHRPPGRVPADTVFFDSLPDAITAAKTAAGDQYVSILGADIARQCLDLGVLDEVLVFLVPVLLGAGTRFLDRPGHPSVALEALRIERVPPSVGAWYRVAEQAV